MHIAAKIISFNMGVDMKIVIFLALLSLTNIALAVTSLLEYKLYNQTNNYNLGPIINVSIMRDGSVELSQSDSDPRSQILVSQLNIESLMEINGRINLLQNAQIQKEEVFSICKIFVIDETVGTLKLQVNNKLEIILNAQACWNTLLIRPADEQLYQEAESLKSLLEELVKELISIK